MDISRISVSRKGVWDECQQLYKYRYHLKIKPNKPEPFYFVYGTGVHKIAEVYVESRGARTIGEVATDVIRGKIEIEPGVKMPALPPEYQRRLPGHLRAIENLTGRIGLDGKLEYEFEYDLDPPNQKCVTGFIDRLIVKEDKAWIVDYKTTKKGPFRKTPETIVHDLQLRTYARVVQREFGIKAENIRAALYYLENGGEMVAAKFSEESLERAEKELLQAYNDIKEADPDKAWGNVGPHCPRCDYADICPFYSGGSKAMKWDGDLGILS